MKRCWWRIHVVKTEAFETEGPFQQNNHKGDLKKLIFITFKKSNHIFLVPVDPGSNSSRLPVMWRTTSDLCHCPAAMTEVCDAPQCLTKLLSMAVGSKNCKNVSAIFCSLIAKMPSHSDKTDASAPSRLISSAAARLVVASTSLLLFLREVCSSRFLLLSLLKGQ